MPHLPARSTPIVRRRLRAGTVGLVTVAVLVAGCTADPQDAGQAPSPATSGAAGAAHLDLSDLPIPRGDACDLLAQEDLEQALGSPVTTTGHYGNGEEFEVAPGRLDISHEHGCVFEAADGTTARTWIFARPVTRSEARALVRQAHRGRDCAFPESIRFGTPALTSVCEVTGPAGGAATVRARLEGLFGGTWMGCEVSEPLLDGATAPSAAGTPPPRADVVQRAEQWCTEVVTTIAAS